MTDGETGVRELARLCFPETRHQLCEWHVPYTRGRMLGKDGMGIEAGQEITGKLSGILARGGQQAPGELPKAHRQPLELRQSAYAPEQRGPYVLYSPPSAERTTSVMEREMREVNQRTDVGARWSVNGITNLVRLRLAKRHNPDDYERVWSPLRNPASTMVFSC